MNFLYKADNHFNIANLVTMVNISAGLMATYFITQNNFMVAIVLIWIGGACDIFDGKLARKHNLSNEFGIQLDSFADFLSFVLVPVFLIFQAIYTQLEGVMFILAGMTSIYYVISGLRRLIKFNIEADAGEVDKYFTGVPTPLGAILLWMVYLAGTFDVISGSIVVGFMGMIGWMLNSDIRVKHP